jgi:hypothetical protein
MMNFFSLGQGPGVERFSAHTLRAFLFAVAFVLPGSVLGQSFQTCDSDINLAAGGEEPFFINEEIPITVTIESGAVFDGQANGLLRVESFDYKPDCAGGTDFLSCTPGGNTVIISTPDGAIGGSCGADFTTSTSDGGLTYVFTPASPIELAPYESCTVEFNITVLSVPGGSGTILETGGWAESQAECYTVAGEPYLGTSAAGELSFELSTERAMFVVTKHFTDNSTDEVEVFLRCNSGLPLEQSFTLGDGDWVGFIVKEYGAGNVDCRVWEEPVPGNYAASYEATDDGGKGYAQDIDDDEDGCYYEGVQTGSFTCDITNTPEPATYTVEKDWVVPAAGYEEMDYDVDVEIWCDTEILKVDGSSYTAGSYWSGTLADGEDVTVTVDTTEGATACEASEAFTQSGVEASESSACGGADLEAGDSVTCTFTNTVFFEGIPTLSQYGLALLALLMLGVGFVGFRRFA